MGSLQQVSPGSERREANQAAFYRERRVAVKKFRYHADIVGRPLVIAELAGAESSYLLVVTMDSWVITGSHESLSISLEAMKNLEIVRIYTPASQLLWARLDDQILSGEIHVRER